MRVLQKELAALKTQLQGIDTDEIAELKARVVEIETEAQLNQFKEHKAPATTASAKESLSADSDIYRRLQQQFTLDIEKLRTESIRFQKETKAVDLKQDQFQQEIYMTV